MCTIIQRILLWGVIASTMALTTGTTHAQTITYSLGTASELLDAAFYAGEAVDGSDAAGRLVLNFGVSNSGSFAIFWALNRANFQQGLFRVTIGDPSSWERLTADQGFDYDQITFAPDDSKVFLGSRVYDIASETIQTGVTIHGYGFSEATVTHKPTGNWLATARNVGVDENSEILMLPILNDGTEDPSRVPVQVTKFGIINPPGSESPLTLAWVANDGSAVAFIRWDTSFNPDDGDVYVLDNLGEILSAPKLPATDISSLAPESLSDPNVTPIRITGNLASTPSFSQDGDLVFYAEDYNNNFDFENFFASLSGGDWDMNLCNRDGSGHVRFTQPNNSQSTLKPFTTGSRLYYLQEVTDVTDIHVYATTLIAENNIETQTAPLDEGETTATIDGEVVELPFTLTDSAVQLSTPVEVEDSSGTIVELPADQVINFPEGTTTKAISILTPIDPVAPNQLPPDAPETAIPIIRTFGPPNTQFAPPITITISYTDAEVASIPDEQFIRPYLLDPETNIFVQIPQEDIVDVDTLNNTVTFKVSHFSTYGIGGLEVEVPNSPWMLASIALLISLTGIVFLKQQNRSRN
ncbi:MAG: hypothetical protein HYV27_10405 [Candidatus Hydrogenedentes bacterium]|nr:hypothetical protein [Candidatus Hydrogenedentota bacterium]